MPSAYTRLPCPTTLLACRYRPPVLFVRLAYPLYSHLSRMSSFPVSLVHLAVLLTYWSHHRYPCPSVCLFRLSCLTDLLTHLACLSRPSRLLVLPGLLSPLSPAHLARLSRPLISLVRLARFCLLSAPPTCSGSAVPRALIFALISVYAPPSCPLAFVHSPACLLPTLLSARLHVLCPPAHLLSPLHLRAVSSLACLSRRPPSRHFCLSTCSLCLPFFFSLALAYLSICSDLSALVYFDSLLFHMYQTCSTLRPYRIYHLFHIFGVISNNSTRSGPLYPLLG